MVEQEIRALKINPELDLIIFDEHTLETDIGWVFFWNSRQYIEQGDYRYALAGNGPFLVDRCDGSIHQFPTAYPTEENLERYRQSH